MMMSSILRLRLLNLAGAAVFATYGVLIHAWPVAVLNTVTATVNAGHLFYLLRARKCFQLLKLRPDSEYLHCFLGFYDRKIRQILPEFKYRPSRDQVALFLLRDCMPVGVFLADQKPDGVLHVLLDFVIPNYRDLKIGRFLFVEQAEFFRSLGIREIVISPRTAKFRTYLARVGFEPVDHPAGPFRIRYARPVD
jgi:hypothetical protein